MMVLLVITVLELLVPLLLVFHKASVPRANAISVQLKLCAMLDVVQEILVSVAMQVTVSAVQDGVVILALYLSPAVLTAHSSSERAVLRVFIVASVSKAEAHRILLLQTALVP
jgi:hypothetical protein